MHLNPAQKRPSPSLTMASSHPATGRGQNRHTQLLMQFNKDMFKRNVLTDVDCIVEGQVFKTHRAVLICFSPYVKRKLLNTAGKPIANQIKIPKIGSNEFEILLQYMYTGNLEIDCNSFYDVYIGASLLEMQHVKLECLQIIGGTDEIRAYFYTYILSKKLGIQQNWEKALKLIAHRFEETALSKEFAQLQLSYVREILSAPSIGARSVLLTLPLLQENKAQKAEIIPESYNTCGQILMGILFFTSFSETIVFLAALNWLNHDFGRRITDAVGVMQCVHFSSMTMLEIIACYHPPFLPQIVQIPDVITMLYRATCYVAAKSQGQESWFKQYASPKRILTLANLQTELWHHPLLRPSYAEGTEVNEQEKERLQSWERTSQLIDQPTEVQSVIPKSQMNLLLNNLSDTHNFDEESRNEPDMERVENDSKSWSSVTQNDENRCGFKREKHKSRNSISKKLHTSVSCKEVQQFVPQHMKILHLRKQPETLTDQEHTRHGESLAVGVQQHTENNEGEFLQIYVPSVKKGKCSEDVDKTVQTYGPCCLFSKEAGEINTKNVSLQSTKPSSMKEKLKKTETFTTKKLDDKLLKFDEIQQSRAKTEEKNQAPIKKVNFKQRSEEESYILIIGGMNPKNIKEEIGAGASVSIYDQKVKKWLPYCSLPEPRHNHCAAVIDNILYVVGGCKPQETIEENRPIATRSCYKLELKNKRWSRLPDMKCARFDHGLVAYYGLLYVVGGQDENDRLLKSVEVYDPFRNRWRLLNSTMCCGRKAMGVAVFDERIWVAGGLIQSEEGNHWLAVSHVDCYSTTEKRWYFNTYLLPGPRCFCNLAVWNGKLYCIAGMIQVCEGKTGPTDEVWFVGSENDLWKKGPSLPEPKMGGVAVIHDHSLYFLGGFDPNCDDAIPKTYVLTTSSSSWEEGPPLLSHLFGLSGISFTPK